MQRDRVPDSDHVSRYCGGAQVHEDGHISGTAFRLRESEEYLSVNWLEYLALADRHSQIDEIRRVLGAKRKLGSRARLAVLNTGRLRERVATATPDGRMLDILHDPEPVDPSHAGIFGLRKDDTLISELIAQSIQETYPARNRARNPESSAGAALVSESGAVAK
ncbi:MAG: hypothetical protein ACREWG_05580 [Gammaproteobacteria bacterium]